MKSLATILTILTLYVGRPAFAEKVYWTDGLNGVIRRADLDGSNIEDLVTGAGRPVNIALDLPGGKMFWVDTISDQIYRANLDGTGVESVVTLGPPSPFQSEGYGIAVDSADGKLYYTNEAHDNKVFRSNLDGTAIETVIAVTDGNPFALALDLSAQKVYFSHEGGPSGRIQRVNFDGSELEDLVTTGLGSLGGIALDQGLGKMIWTDSGLSNIRRADFDGTNVENLVTSDLQFPWGIAIDALNSKMYWADANVRSIRRANLDGTEVETLVSETGHAFGVALDLRPVPEPTSLALLAVVIACAAFRLLAPTRPASQS